MIEDDYLNPTIPHLIARTEGRLEELEKRLEANLKDDGWLTQKNIDVNLEILKMLRSYL